MHRTIAHIGQAKQIDTQNGSILEVAIIKGEICFLIGNCNNGDIECNLVVVSYATKLFFY